MRSLLATLLSPCLICPALIVGAFYLDGVGVPGRAIGTLAIVIGFWLPEILAVCGWAVGCPGASCRIVTVTGKVQKSEPEPPPPWWMRRYMLTPFQILLLCGLGGSIVGCTVPIYLRESNLGSFLTWGGWFSVLGSMVGLAGPLLDERHLHHRAFLACTRHVFYFGFVVLFAFGLWQALPIWFALLLSCGLWSVTILVMGACWGLTSLIRNAAAWPEYHFRQDGTHG